jgi:ABC-type amino acid transport system permease subunit
MSGEHISPSILFVVEIVAIAVTTSHLVLEIVKWRRKTQDRAPRSRVYHPTFSVIVSTLLLIGSILLLIVSYIRPQVLPTFWEHATIIRRGMTCTIAVSFLAILLGSTIGIVFALVLAIPKRNVFLSLIDSALLSLIYILLGIPAIGFLFVCWYGTPLKNIFLASVLALGINLAPFVAKIVLASIRNISSEQIAAAISFGYSRWQRFWFFEVLFVVKNAGQALLVEYYTTIKLSSLASIFSLYETYHAIDDIRGNTYDPVSAYIIMALCYVAIVTWIAVLADYLAQKWQPLAD